VITRTTAITLLARYHILCKVRGNRNIPSVSHLDVNKRHGYDADFRQNSKMVARKTVIALWTHYFFHGTVFPFPFAQVAPPDKCPRSNKLESLDRGNCIERALCGFDRWWGDMSLWSIQAGHQQRLRLRWMIRKGRFILPKQLHSVRSSDHLVTGMVYEGHNPTFRNNQVDENEFIDTLKEGNGVVLDVHFSGLIR